MQQNNVEAQMALLNIHEEIMQRPRGAVDAMGGNKRRNKEGRQGWMDGDQEITKGKQ